MNGMGHNSKAGNEYRQSIVSIFHSTISTLTKHSKPGGTLWAMNIYT